MATSRRRKTLASFWQTVRPFRLLNLIFILPTATFVSAGEFVASRSPNVLMISVDDLNDWVGFLNQHPQALTPNMDRIAERGIVFSNAHCASPACNPSRASIFTGRMPWQTGVWSNRSYRLMQAHPDTRVLPLEFKDAGYRTLGTGKLMHSTEKANAIIFDQHFNVEQRWSPLTRDLVRYRRDELASKGTQNPRHEVVFNEQPMTLPLNGMPSDRSPDKADGESFDWGPMDIPDSAMGDSQITDWAIERLSDESEKPFFMGVGYYRPHIPLWAPAKYFDRLKDQNVVLPPHLSEDLRDLSTSGKRWALEADTAGLHSTVVAAGQWEEAVKGYLACTTFVDSQIGRLLDALENSRHRDNTMIVLFSDHGWHLGEKQHWGKWTGWERSTRVPLVIVLPNGQTMLPETGAKSCDVPVSLIDLHPTLTELCGIESPANLDGQSLVPMLQNPGQASTRVAISVFDRGNISVRDSSFRLIRYADDSTELYNIDHDPNEWKNLANNPSYATVVERLRQQIPDEAIGLQD